MTGVYRQWTTSNTDQWRSETPTDEDYQWQPVGGNGVWDSGNSEWDSVYNGEGFYLLFLEDLGTWATGYRPVLCRITFSDSTGSIDAIVVADSSFNEIGISYGTPNTSNQILVVLDFDIESAGDIGLFYITAEFQFSVSNIEFLE